MATGGRDSQIENRNFLAPVGFKFSLKRSPGVAFMCNQANICLLYTSPSPRDLSTSRMPSSA